MEPMRVGVHTSISGSLEKAALKAAGLGANTFQIFSASPRMWKAGSPDPAQIRLLQKVRDAHDLFPLVVHDNYLINMASCSEQLRQQSVVAFRGEIQRAIAIGAEYLVAHPGNCKGHSVEQGIYEVVRSLVEASRGIETRSLTVLLENTADSGAALGSRFEELASIRDYAAHFTDLRLGFCIDTCHCHSSGYDVSSAAGVRRTVASMESVLGIDNVKVIHSNDSKTPFHSRVDRHAHIGHGYIGEEGFRSLLNDPKLRNKAFILETPVDEDGDELKNIETLKRLCRKSRTTRKLSK